MKIGCLINVFCETPLPDVLSFCKTIGIEMVEIGCGAINGIHHCNAEALIEDDEAFKKFKATVERSGLGISAFACHANPVHPVKEIERNISAGIIPKFSQRLFGVIDKQGMHDEVVHEVEDLGIKLGKLSDPVSSLSGGNQQRVVLAKWLAIHPKVLMLNCPTVGVDVGSKQNIHETIKRLANDGIGIIVISDDLPEILNVCSRVLVMNKGSFTGEYATTQLDENMLQGMLAKA